ncbi:prominin-like protein [Drosophila grimshawi]|uniref:prominin-like protein n=1 Tax=Drosophila grimshawi TaxID=7222 RepID=UPI001C933EFF|nr:prominin-like protein [Drosophila grimshawi]
MCRPLTPNLDTLSAGLRTVRDNIYYDPDWDYWNKYGRYSLSNEALQFDTYNKEWTEKIRNIMDKMKQNLIQIDELILYENRDYSDSIEVLLSAVQRSEIFIRENGKEFVNALGANLTDVVNEQIDQFLHDLVRRCNEDVGHCTPLAYIYYRGVDLICYRLVDPMNGFWVGMLLAALLLLPILIVAHKLMCLWKRMHAAILPVVVVVPEGGCPTCTGAAYVPPPIMVCTGGQQTGAFHRTDGGVARSVDSVPQAGANAAAASGSNAAKDTLGVRFHPEPPTKPKKE